MKIRISKDILWKAAIEDLVEDFLTFFFEDYFSLINFQHPIEFLDKELATLLPESPNNKRHADKLLKVNLKSGRAHYFLVHVEVQGYDDNNFSYRMYQCAYRIRERYGWPVTALAIYTSSNSKFHFREYREEFMGSELIYRFNTFILKEHSINAIAKKDNPFALILEVAWYHLREGKVKDAELLALKLALVKKLYAKNYKKKKIKQILSFIKYYVVFEEQKNFNKFEEVITKSEGPMGIEEAIIQSIKEQAEEYYREKSLKEGLEQGKKQGLEQGKKQGLEQGKKQGIEEGKKQGREEGREEGRKQGIEKGVALTKQIVKLHLDGKPVSRIAEVTNQSVNFVKQLLQEVGLI